MRTSRRETFGLATGLLGVMAGKSVQAMSASRVHLTLSQAPWSARENVRRLTAQFAALVGTRTNEAAYVLVLPPADREKKVPRAEAFYAQLGGVAQATGCFIASAANIQVGGRSVTEGFLIGPDGKTLIRMPKIMPNAWAGFTEDASALTVPSVFPVAKLPFGNIGILVGEDLYRASHVRALCFNGAEIILNPSIDPSDAASPARREVMTAIAYCNSIFLGAATSGDAGRTSLWDWQGNVSAAEGAATIRELIDIESLRVSRQLGVTNLVYSPRSLLPMVRDGVYGPAFTAAAQASQRAASAIPVDVSGWLKEAQRRIADQAVRKTPDDQLISIYDVALVQSPRRVITSAPDRKAAIGQNIKDFLALAEPYARRPLTKLVMFGEFAFTAAGFRTIPDALSATLKWPGPELEQLANFAAKHGVYVAAQQLEEDAKFPGRVFNTAFLFDSSGRLISRHRKIQCVDIMGTLPDTTPGSIYDSYVEEYGTESLFEVVDTPLGKLAPMICFENMFPEIAQIYAHRGAEVYLHLTSEGWDSITETRYAWNNARRQHALEATAYLLSVNQGDDPLLRDPYHVVGECQAHDPYGRNIGMLRESRPGVLVARVDLNLLRTARSDPRINLGIWDEPSVYAAAYMQGHALGNNTWLNVPASEFPYRDMAIYKDVVRRLNQRGIFTPPRGAMSSI